jgi:hypothetical protein
MIPSCVSVKEVENIKLLQKTWTQTQVQNWAQVWAWNCLASPNYYQCQK